MVMMLKGKSYTQIGKRFGFSTQRAQQIGRALIDNGYLQPKDVVEEKMVREKLAELDN